MSTKLKVGVMGAYRGMTMIRTLAKHPDAEVVAICDFHQPVLDECKKFCEENDKKNVVLYSDFEDFFKHDLDAVVLANYADEHAPYAIRLLKSGRHVMSEVLPVANMKEAVELCEAVEESGKVYTYAENYCYFLSTFEMKRRYQNGFIGEIRHAECEYIHDCTSIWPQITYGDKDHWRNRLFANFYCTHSIGPILTITGLRPVKVVGFEVLPDKRMMELGSRSGNAGIEILELENGATVKSVHGGLKREPSSVWYNIYGTRGFMESDRWGEGVCGLNAYREDSDKSCQGDLTHYKPDPYINTELAKEISSHGGGDFYTVYFFIEKILGREDGKHAIDVYTAVDMGICGIQAYRSVLNGNIPMEIPNFRDKAVREQYRNDTACCNSAAAGDQLWPSYSKGELDIPDSAYEYTKKLWQDGQPG